MSLPPLSSTSTRDTVAPPALKKRLPGIDVRVISTAKPRQTAADMVKNFGHTHLIKETVFTGLFSKLFKRHTQCLSMILN